MKKGNMLLKFFGLLFSALIFFTGCGSNTGSNVTETMAEEQNAPQLSASEEDLHSQYSPRKGIETILFIGLDKFEAKEDKFGYLNDQQCDFLMLFVLDEEDGSCDVLHLNRDTKPPNFCHGVSV